MKKTLVVVVALSSVSTRAEDAMEAHEFLGRAEPLVKTTEMDDAAAMCCNVEKRASCVGQCAQVWFERDAMDDCPFKARTLARVADRCVPCQWGQLALSQEVFHFATTHVEWTPVRWRCVKCVANGGDDVFERGAERQEAGAFVNTTDQPLHNGSHSISASSSDVEVELPSVGTNDSSKSTSGSDHSSENDAWSSGSTASGHVSCSPPTGDASLSPTAVQRARIASNSSSASNNRTSRHIRVPQAASTSSSLPGATTDKPRLATVPPALHPDASPPKRYDTLSATSAVRNSPFFYASIMLGIVGLAGIVVGCRANQKRRNRDEERSFHAPARTLTSVSNSHSALSSSAALASQARLDDSPSSVIL